MASDEVSKKGKKPDTDLKIVARDEDAGTFTAEIFGEKFLFDAHANGWLTFMASTGKAEHLEKLIHSMILLDDDEMEGKTDAEQRVARMREAERFSENLGSQRDLTIERMFRLVNDIIEAAGNDHTDS